MTRRTPPEPIYVRVCDSQAVFGIHRSTIYRRAAQGKITIYRDGGTSFVKVSEMADMIEGRSKEVSAVGP